MNGDDDSQHRPYVFWVDGFWLHGRNLVMLLRLIVQMSCDLPVAVALLGRGNCRTAYFNNS